MLWLSRFTLLKSLFKTEKCKPTTRKTKLPRTAALSVCLSGARRQGRCEASLPVPPLRRLQFSLAAAHRRQIQQELPSPHRAKAIIAVNYTSRGVYKFDKCINCFSSVNAGLGNWPQFLQWQERWLHPLKSLCSVTSPQGLSQKSVWEGPSGGWKWKWFWWLKESALIMCSSGRINRRQEVTGKTLLLSLVDSTLNPSKIWHWNIHKMLNVYFRPFQRDSGEEQLSSRAASIIYQLWDLICKMGIIVVSSSQNYCFTWTNICKALRISSETQQPLRVKFLLFHIKDNFFLKEKLTAAEPSQRLALTLFCFVFWAQLSSRQYKKNLFQRTGISFRNLSSNKSVLNSEDLYNNSVSNLKQSCSKKGEFLP